MRFDVIGTGPAGLAAAFLLTQRKHQVRLIDRAETPGGLWAGWTDKGCHFERGMHTYVECGVKEIDDWFFGLPLQYHLLAGEDRERAGVFWNGALNIHAPYINLAAGAEGEWRENLSEILIAGILDEHFADRALDRASALFGPRITSRHITPILKKLYGDPTKLLARALDLTNLTRVVMLPAAKLAPLMAVEAFRTRLGWPMHETLATPYWPKRRSFYPVEGMRALVHQALVYLEAIGVEICLGQAVKIDPDQRVIWAAPLQGLCYALDKVPPVLAARSLTVVNYKGDITAGNLHYFFDYSDGPGYRVTCYHNFTFNRAISVELLDTPAAGADAAARDLLTRAGTGAPLELAGIHELGSVLTLPTATNDEILRNCRPHAPNVTVVGQAARPGLFFQPDVLRNVFTTINSIAAGGSHGDPAGRL